MRIEGSQTLTVQEVEDVTLREALEHVVATVLGRAGETDELVVAVWGSPSNSGAGATLARSAAPSA